MSPTSGAGCHGKLLLVLNCMSICKGRLTHKMTRGEKIVAFIEHYCLIPEGAQVGQPIKLMKFQRKFILDVFDNPHG